MEKENINFVAIDFETMTPELTSACAVYGTSSKWCNHAEVL